MTALHYEMRGRGKDLVLLHGWGLNLGVWDELSRALARRFRVISIDLPGHGRSDWDPRAVTPAAQAWRVHETLAPLSERYSLLGWSLGGQFALDLAAAMPAGIERLALIATTPKFLASAGWRCGMAPAQFTRLSDALSRGHDAAFDDFLALCARGSAPRTAARVQKQLRLAVQRHGAAHPEALANGLERLKECDLRSALPLLRVPALVIAGAADRITRAAAARALAVRLDGARYVEFAGAAHAPFLSHPARFAATLTRFLRG
ncbi:MAG: alpha/beta fold hydrolase [Steroidobacterales bacterium]|jgi:pimeloyl-[acyl-carrier protein] methyl ester esterase